MFIELHLQRTQTRLARFLLPSGESYAATRHKLETSTSIIQNWGARQAVDLGATVQFLPYDEIETTQTTFAHDFSGEKWSAGSSTGEEQTKSNPYSSDLWDLEPIRTLVDKAIRCKVSFAPRECRLCSYSASSPLLNFSLFHNSVSILSFKESSAPVFQLVSFCQRHFYDSAMIILSSTPCRGIRLRLETYLAYSRWVWDSSRRIRGAVLVLSFNWKESYLWTHADLISGRQLLAGFRLRSARWSLFFFCVWASERVILVRQITRQT